MKKMLYPLLGLGLVLGTGCGTKYNVHGYVVNEHRWEAGSFGWLYRIEIAPTGSSTRGAPYVFVGSGSELQKLDEEINVGDKVDINDETTAFSLDLEKVLTPKHIRKK